MNLIIHDLNEKEWAKIASDYEGWKVISDKGDISPCAGCFGCWLKTPGQCVIKDGYDKMGQLIHSADEVVVISRYTYGGFSSFVKNVLDRSIGYILPFFRLVKGEMHHQPRFHEKKPFRFIFRGENLTEEDKEKAKKYVKAVCINFNGRIKDIQFWETEAETGEAAEVSKEQEVKTETLFLNCSLRGDESRSRKFLDIIADNTEGEKLQLNVTPYLKKMDELRDEVFSAKKVVLGMPLYVDGIPSTALKLMELLEKECAAGSAVSRDKKIYVVANMGFFESEQIGNLLSMVKTWCEKCGFTYCGGIAIGAGGMMGNVIKYGHHGPGKFVYEELLRAAEAINASGVIGDIYTKSYKFPRIGYIMYGNKGFLMKAKENGLRKRDLYKKTC
ncbi:flavodoxin family protein [Butyrivibrio sp. MC2021]|uniref:flavodoxin family protein n=1 Tax=Butyrivibrio sp. MC2021 TaxID=1408306 RepID=UPI000ABC285E|nr:flavodoxin family protein [Butyrivibrio sp. MC2021]